MRSASLSVHYPCQPSISFASGPSGLIGLLLCNHRASKDFSCFLRQKIGPFPINNSGIRVEAQDAHDTYVTQPTASRYERGSRDAILAGAAPFQKAPSTESTTRTAKSGNYQQHRLASDSFCHASSSCLSTSRGHPTQYSYLKSLRGGPGKGISSKALHQARM